MNHGRTLTHWTTEMFDSFCQLFVVIWFRLVLNKADYPVLNFEHVARHVHRPSPFAVRVQGRSNGTVLTTRRA